MNIYKHIKMAEEMDLHKGFAIQARKRYLNSRIYGILTEIIELDGWVDGVCDINSEFAFQTIMLLCEEKRKIDKELTSIKSILKPSKAEITDDMIETAKEHLVENLIDFRRGKAVAFCHEDKNPSLFHGTRNNIAVCPVCDKHFNAIDILMERDGMSFINAVKELN